ncbi:TniB family NTP-binding protein [Caulobacter henricii]|uniref:Transposase n=1 Tax=Caulobacter henricii TaxID=69395 RepID=A0A0P0NYG5_9CAUL|nr:TniB family NTP-binding protein [Caulobacter henricii]ALL13172.1 transposase [Caulobacter henricii]
MAFDGDENNSPEYNGLVAEAIAKFKSINVPYPPQVLFHARCDYLQKLGLANEEKPQMGLRILAPSGSGKSTAALEYKAMVERRTPPTDTFVPVLYIALDSASTSKRLMVQILHALGDPLAERGTEQALRKRAIDYLRRLGVQLLIIDEVQHLSFRSTAKADVTDALKSFLDAGVTPIVFAGTEDARRMFESNLQLNGRLLAPLDMPKLESSKSEDRNLFASFVWGLCDGMCERKVLKTSSSIVGEGVLGPLMEVTDGVVGRVARLFEVAIEIAIRRGSNTLEVADLSLAVDRWAIPQNFAKRNPFRARGKK